MAKSPIAKKFGIKTGEPIYYARKKCPGVLVFAADHGLYQQYSDRLYELFLEYTDQIERFSVDECFLDMTYFIRKGETLLEKAKEINKRVEAELGFTVNVGVSTNKLLAKMASDFEKPNKVHTLFLEEIETKMWPLPIAELFMVGRKTLPKLERMHIRTIGDLAKYDKEVLAKEFGKHGKLMWEYANGIDNARVEYEQNDPKAIGNSITLPKDIDQISKLKEILLSLIEKITYRLRKHEMYATVVNVQLKTNEFKVVSHQKKIQIATNSTKEIYLMAAELLEELYQGQPIRLIGARVDGLCKEKERQLSIFDKAQDQKQKNLDQVLDRLKDRYGYTTITRAGEMNLKNIFDHEQKN